MFRFTKWAMAGLALAAAPLLGGCQSHRSAHASTIACDRCTVVDVRTPYSVPGYEGSRPAGYFTTKGMDCSGCKAAATAHASTGELAPTCNVCGGNIHLAQAK